MDIDKGSEQQDKVKATALREKQDERSKQSNSQKPKSPSNRLTLTDVTGSVEPQTNQAAKIPNALNTRAGETDGLDCSHDRKQEVADLAGSRKETCKPGASTRPQAQSLFPRLFRRVLHICVFNPPEILLICSNPPALLTNSICPQPRESKYNCDCVDLVRFQTQ